MIIYDQLRISDDAKTMYINAHVNEASYFDDVYVDSVVIMLADDVSETDPGTPTTDYIYKKTYTDSVKDVDLTLTVNDFLPYSRTDMSQTLFFVYVICKGTPSSDTPCGLDNMTTLEVVYDEKMLYQKVMEYTKKIVNSCCTNVGFTDFILLWHAFKASIETGHYIQGIKFFNMLFDLVDDTAVVKTGCGCNG